VDINRAGESMRENINISNKGSLGYYELKKHKPWLEERGSELLYQRKQAKLYWIKGQSKINGDNLKQYKT
jgi:hypothetical protein